MIDLERERRYDWEFAQLEALCQQYLNIRDSPESDTKLGTSLLLVGMICGQCAAIYRLGEPIGLLDMSEMFKPRP